MSILRKIGALCTSAVLLSGIPQWDFMLSQPIDAHAEVTEVRTYVEEGGSRAETDKKNVYYNTWTITYYYTLTYTQYWDDELGEAVYDYQSADIVDIVIYEESYGAMQAPDTYDENEYSLEKPDSMADILIPEKIEDVPVTSISDIMYEVHSGGWACLTNFNVYIPETILNAGLVSYEIDETYYLGMHSPSPELTFFYKGTCQKLLENGYSGGSFTCSDGIITPDRVDYDGTCEEWKSICPEELSEVIAYCSDGIVNPPLPTHEDYTFIREPASAVFTGKAAENCTSFMIPNSIYGFPVLSVPESVAKDCYELSTVVIGDNAEAIEDYAFLNCKSLTKIVIPPNVTEIGEYAVGYWLNSDGTYSPMSKTVIYCVEGSAAHKYAVDNGLTFELVEESGIYFEMGDVNTDGTVTSADLVTLQKYLVADSEMTVEGALRADICDNGAIDSSDAAALRVKLNVSE